MDNNNFLIGATCNLINWPLILRIWTAFNCNYCRQTSEKSFLFCIYIVLAFWFAGACMTSATSLYDTFAKLLNILYKNGTLAFSQSQMSIYFEYTITSSITQEHIPERISEHIAGQEQSAHHVYTLRKKGRHQHQTSPWIGNAAKVNHDLQTDT